MRQELDTYRAERDGLISDRAQAIRERDEAETELNAALDKLNNQ